MSNPTVILTTFAGRHSCMPLLLKYVKDLMDANLVHEFHAWNYTKSYGDELWLKQEIPSHIYPSKSITNTVQGSDYIATGLSINSIDITVSLDVKTSGDGYIMLKSRTSDTVYEIHLGGWGNQCSVIRQGIQGKYMTHSVRQIFSNLNDFVNIKVKVTSNTIEVNLNNQPLLYKAIDNRLLEIFDVYVASWGDNSATWRYKDLYSFSEDLQLITNNTPKNQKMKLFHPVNKKSWGEFYKHYTQERYPDHIIVKCDDDICFIDTLHFSDFINRRIKDHQHIFTFPSIVNNEICAYYQQEHDLLPKGFIGYQPMGFGTLWRNGIQAENLHNMFLDNPIEFIKKSLPLKTIDIINNHRVSINFFAVKSKDLHVFQLIGDNDEGELTQIIPGKLKREHCIDMGLVVSHLAFYKQRQTGMNVDKIYKRYTEFYDQWNKLPSDTFVIVPAEPTTETPVEHTETPVEPTEVPVETTETPVEPTTEVPVEHTETPVEHTEVPVEPSPFIQDRNIPPLQIINDSSLFTSSSVPLPSVDEIVLAPQYKRSSSVKNRRKRR